MNALISPASATPSQRPVPVNFDAEKALLAALLANNEVYFKVCDFLAPEHFYDALHGRIYEAIGRLIGRGLRADPVTLKNLFDQDGALAEIGGAKYLVELAQSVVTVLNADDYARAVRDLWLRRRILAISDLVTEDARLCALDRDAEDVLEGAEAMLAELAAGASGNAGLVPIGGVVTTALEEIQAAWHRGFGGLNTGFPSWNRQTGGLAKSDLIILAGRPGMGKTTLADNLVLNVADYAVAARLAEQDPIGAVAFFSHEMSNPQIVKKMMARRSGISAHRMRRGSIDHVAWDYIAEAAREIEALPIFLDDSTNLSAGQMLSRARRVQRKHGLSLIVVDYLQLMRGEGKNDNRTQEVGAITRGLKAMAKQLDVPVLALSQLSRKVEERDDKRPSLADLRESGSIEQDADVVMFVYRAEYYLKDAEPRRRGNETQEHFNGRLILWQEQLSAAQNKSEIIVAKQRHGPTGSFMLGFDGAKDSFEDLDEVA